jgi:hypothetical protein
LHVVTDFKKYFIDIDGVVRNFCKKINLENTEEWTKVPKEYLSDIKKNPKKYLYDVECYEDAILFLKDVIGEKNITFLTNQCGNKEREYWTKKFIDKHFDLDHNIVFVKNFDEKIEILKLFKDMFLIDDYTNFYKNKEFNKIKERFVLCLRSWNRRFKNNYLHYVDFESNF